MPAVCCTSATPTRVRGICLRARYKRKAITAGTLKKSQSSYRLWRIAASVLVALLPVVPAHGRVRKSDAWAHSQFDTAERMREALNGRPAQERTRQQYQKVINAYRRIYFGSPTSS